MDIRTKLNQMFILGTEGGGYNDALKNGLGGMIFFTRDIQSLKQFRELINAQIAQLVEQRTENPRVAGSIPALGIHFESDN